MTPTKEQIEEAANLICGAETFEGVGFKVGARWALEQVAPRWIPVEERLPEDGKHVILAFEEKEVGDGHYVKESNCFYRHSYGGDIAYRVTHWQERPHHPTK